MPKLYQLAQDVATYGADAGRWLIVSDDLENELSKPMSEADAERNIREARIVVRPVRQVYYRNYGELPGPIKCHFEPCDFEPERAEFWGAYWDCEGLQAWLADFTTRAEAKTFANTLEG